MIAVLEKILAQDQFVYCLRILLALGCGVLLGMERAKRSKDPGIRTHSILAMGAALFMILSKYAFFDLVKGGALQGLDPTLIACYVIDGSGFLCAGIIFNKKQDDTITGMTTAAGVWATAAIGMACGAGLGDLGLIFTLLLLLQHWVLSRRGLVVLPMRTLRLTVEHSPDLTEVLRTAQEKYGIRVISARYTRSADDNTISMLLKIRSKRDIPFRETIRFIDEHPEVKDISF